VRDTDTTELGQERSLTHLLEHIYHRCGHDFRDYARPSLRRRLERAMQHLRLDSLDELGRMINRDPRRFDELLPDLTVPVSGMFRDPHYFFAFRHQVVPVLRSYPSLRLWVAGCCGGEEAFSLAIVLAEEGLLERSVIYATDINPVALARAERAILPLEQLRSYTENYQRAGGRRAFSDYYFAGYEHAVVERKLRERIVFAEHSLTTDSVFSEVQFISCRNVLIYFNRPLQRRVKALFADALSRRGLLGLGARESIDVRRPDCPFETYVKSARIYRLKGERHRMG
jgi:chemotaxis protein methyltransferase CheR